MSRVLRITDCDTGESTLDIVPVPEGFSLQLKYEDDLEFRSIIVSPADASRIVNALASPSGETHDSTRMPPKAMAEIADHFAKIEARAKGETPSEPPPNWTALDDARFYVQRHSDGSDCYRLLRRLVAEIDLRASTRPAPTSEPEHLRQCKCGHAAFNHAESIQGERFHCLEKGCDCDGTPLGAPPSERETPGPQHPEKRNAR